MLQDWLWVIVDSSSGVADWDHVFMFSLYAGEVQDWVVDVVSVHVTVAAETLLSIVVVIAFWARARSPISSAESSESPRGDIVAGSRSEWMRKKRSSTGKNKVVDDKKTLGHAQGAGPRGSTKRVESTKRRNNTRKREPGSQPCYLLSLMSLVGQGSRVGFRAIFPPSPRRSARRREYQHRSHEAIQAMS